MKAVSPCCWRSSIAKSARWSWSTRKPKRSKLQLSALFWSSASRSPWCRSPGWARCQCSSSWNQTCNRQSWFHSSRRPGYCVGGQSPIHWAAKSPERSGSAGSSAGLSEWPRRFCRTFWSFVSHSSSIYSIRIARSAKSQLSKGWFWWLNRNLLWYQLYQPYLLRL